MSNQTLKPWAPREEVHVVGEEQVHSTPLYNGETAPWVPLERQLVHQDDPGAAPVEHPFDAGEQRLHEAFERGAAAGREQAEGDRKRYAESVARVMAFYEARVEETKEVLVQLVCRVVGQLIGHDVRLRQPFTKHLVTYAATALEATGGATIRVHPDDMAYLSEQFPRLFVGDARLKVVSDTSVGLAGVIAESRAGRMDATLAQRLRDAANALREGLGLQPSEAAHVPVDDQALDLEFVDEVVAGSGSGAPGSGAGAPSVPPLVGGEDRRG